MSARIENCDQDLIDAMGIKDLLFSQFNLGDDVQFDNKLFSSSDQAQIEDISSRIFERQKQIAGKGGQKVSGMSPPIPIDFMNLDEMFSQNKESILQNETKIKMLAKQKNQIKEEL